MPACDWTKTHSDQGFARRHGAVAFGTLLEFGRARVSVIIGGYALRAEYERVIAVPFQVISGTLIVDGPEETETGRERNFDVRSGSYRLVAAQCITGNDREVIDLYFEAVSSPLKKSAILLADNALNPPPTLLESAGIAGEQ
jgi:hypothetical protein